MSEQQKQTEQKPVLESCPFCGRPATAEKITYGGQDFWRVGCPDNCCRGHATTTSLSQSLAIHAWNRRAPVMPLPDGITQADAISGLREIVQDAESAEREKDPTFKRYPTVHALLDHIESHGFPPPNK